MTLLELTIVMLIVSIAAAAAAPRFSAALNRRRVEAAARRVAFDIEWARSTARVKSRSTSVVFDVAKGSYSLSGVLNPNQPGQPYTVVLSEGLYPAKLVSVGWGASATMTFSGFGIPNAGGTIAIQSGNAIKTISVDSDTGTTKIQ